MIAFLNKFFVDKFFILYFYISNSVTYDFYITVFLNFIAVFYFLFMLYALNFIAFLRNNFFNDLRVTKLIGFLFGVSLKHDSERFKQVMGLLAYYGYMVLTILEVSIKSSFLVIIGYFVIKAPFISFDPSPVSSWKFADLFSKSRFYSFRPWTLNSSRSYRGFSSGNFSSEGAWFADDNDYVETLYPQLLPYSKDFDHEDIFLRPGGADLRLRERVGVLAKFSVIGRNSGNWTRHLLGSRRDRGAINKISAPRHRLERTKVYFSRNKSLELKSSVHSSFSYYRSEDDCYPVSAKGGFLSRLYVPGFGSKARRNLLHGKTIASRYDNPINARQKYFVTAFAGVDYHHEADPHINLNKPDESGKRPPAEQDPYKEHWEKDFEKTASVLQSKWLDYVERAKTLHVEDPDNYLSARRFSRAHGKLKRLANKRSYAANRYELPNREFKALGEEERTLMSYFRYLTNEPSDREKAFMKGRYISFLNRNTPFRLVIVDKDESPLYNYTFDNKFSSVHNLRGKHVYRRSLLDFINVRVLSYLRSFSNFFGFKVERGATVYPNPSIDTSSHEELFGFMINDREKFYRRTFKYGIVDDDNRPVQFRGRESFDLNYATAGSKFRYFFDSNSSKAKERIPENSFVDRDADDRETEFDLFDYASDDRIAVNTGVYIHKKLKAEDPYIDRKDFYGLGKVGFLNQYGRMFHQFMLDHLTYWLRIIAGMAGRNHYMPHFPTPASNVADKPQGLNPYAVFFKTFYFFRKCFRVALFSLLSGNVASSSGTGCELKDSPESRLLSETSDFTFIVLQKTVLSYFTRFLGLSLILILNGFSSASGAVLNFALNHITASIFMVLLVIVSLFRVRYPYEFDFNKVFSKSRPVSSIIPMYSSLAKAAGFVATSFRFIVKSLRTLTRFLTIANLQTPRKAKESTEAYYERLAKEQEAITNILNSLKIDRIRRLLSRFGLLRSRDKVSSEGYGKGIFEAVSSKSKLFRRIGSFAYRKKGPSFIGRLAIRIREWFDSLRRTEKRVVTRRRLQGPSLLQYIKKKEPTKPKKKTVYFTFEPTEEFLRIKDSVMAVVNYLRAPILQVRELVRQKQNLKEDSYVAQHKRKKGLRDSFKKVAASTTQASRNTASYIKWKLTEWINKQ